MRLPRVLRLVCILALLSVLRCDVPARPRSPTLSSAAPSSPSPEEQALDRLYQQGDQALDKRDLATAERAFLAGYEKARAAKMERRRAGFLSALGVVYFIQGRFDQALEQHSRALALRKRLGNPREIAWSLGNLGVVYESLGQLDQALKYHHRTLALFQRLSDTEDVAGSLNNLGNVYFRLGRFDQALKEYTDALALRKKLGDEQDIAASLGSLGMVYTSLGRLDRALEYQSRALALFRKLGNRRGFAECLNGLGSIYLRQGRLPQALERHTRALALRQKLGNQKEVAESLNNLGPVYERLGRLNRAEAAYAGAIRHYEAILQQVGQGSEIGAFQQANFDNLYARYARLLVRRKRVAEALALAERGRGRGLALQAAQTGADLSRLTSQGDAARWGAARSALSAADDLREAAQERWEQAKSPAEKNGARAELAAAQERCEQAERQLTLLRADLYRRYPEFRRLRGAAPPTIEALRTLARRNPDTLFLEWTVVDDRTTLLFALSHKDGLRSLTLPVGGTTLEKRVTAWREALTAPGENDPLRRRAALQRAASEPAQARAVSRLLLSPLERAGLLPPGRYARLMLVSDGPLLDVPFAALVDHKGRRLVERYALSTSISLGVLTWPGNPRTPGATLLCVADPLGGHGKVFQSASRGGYGALRYARAEGETVAGMVPGAVAYVGLQARKSLIVPRLDRYALLHFATHGVLDARNGLRSALLLAPESPDGARYEVLEGSEIAGLPLSARLAVLSACESARGQKSGGEGLLGLAWAFRGAGCPSIVASLWRVEDSATRDLMVGFYRNLRAGLGKDEALRRAMLAVRRDPGHAQPFFWAAFQLLGDAAPLGLPRFLHTAR